MLSAVHGIPSMCIVQYVHVQYKRCVYTFHVPKRNFSLYIRYSFLLISDKFCDLSLLHWPLFRAVKRCGRGAVLSEKFHCTGPLEAHSHTTYNPLKSPMGAYVHKTPYGPLLNTALYVMLLMRAKPFLGQVGGGWVLEIQLFWAPNGTHLTD